MGQFWDPDKKTPDRTTRLELATARRDLWFAPTTQMNWEWGDKTRSFNGVLNDLIKEDGYKIREEKDTPRFYKAVLVKADEGDYFVFVKSGAEERATEVGFRINAGLSVPALTPEGYECWIVSNLAGGEDEKYFYVYPPDEACSEDEGCEEFYGWEFF